MPAPDPQQTEQFAESFNLKQLTDDAATFRKALNDVMVASVSAHNAIMTAFGQSIQSNQDLREKFMAKLLELDPLESAATTAILQQSLKGAQTTPPPTV